MKCIWKTLWSMKSNQTKATLMSCPPPVAFRKTKLCSSNCYSFWDITWKRASRVWPKICHVCDRLIFFFINGRTLFYLISCERYWQQECKTAKKNWNILVNKLFKANLKLIKLVKSTITYDTISQKLHTKLHFSLLDLHAMVHMFH